ncbi:MAG: O-antigen ligase family protein, partial [Rhodocyclaceae bacterium]
MKIDRFAAGAHFLSYLALAVLALLVPLFEKQPVNAIAASFTLSVFVWLASTKRSSLGKWDAIDWSVLALLLSALLSTAFGWRGSGSHQGIAEAISHCSLFLYLRYGRHEESALRRLAFALVAGAILASLLTLLNREPGVPFQLPGIRGSIRTALYLGISSMLCIGLALHSKSFKRFIGLVLAVLLTVMVFATSSRAVTVGFGLCLVAGMIAHFRRRALWPILFGTIVMAFAFALQPSSTVDQSKDKIRELIELVGERKISPNDQSRIEIWRASWAWIKQGEHIWFGIGPRNYPLIDKDQLELDPPLQFEQTRKSAHAHNLFLTRYIEQGLVGLTAVIVWIVLIARHLLHDAFHRHTSWAWW